MIALQLCLKTTKTSMSVLSWKTVILFLVFAAPEVIDVTLPKEEEISLGKLSAPAFGVDVVSKEGETILPLREVVKNGVAEKLGELGVADEGVFVRTKRFENEFHHKKRTLYAPEQRQ